MREQARSTRVRMCDVCARRRAVSTYTCATYARTVARQARAPMQHVCTVRARPRTIQRHAYCAISVRSSTSPLPDQEQQNNRPSLFFFLEGRSSASSPLAHQPTLCRFSLADHPQAPRSHISQHCVASAWHDNRSAIFF